MMTVIKVDCSNSMVLPPAKKLLEIETKDSIKEIKKQLRDEFKLKNMNFILFLKIKNKWIILEDAIKQLSDYPLKDKKRKQDKIRLDIKKEVDISYLKKLKKEVQSFLDIEYPYGTLHVETKNAEQTKKLLVEFTRNFIEGALNDPSNVAFSIPSRTSDNIGFDEETELVLLGKQKTTRQFRSLSSVKSVSQLTQLMNIIHDNLSRDIDSTKRDLFYMNVNTFETQGTSDNLIEDIGAMLKVTRPSLNVTASAKGVVVGNIEFTEQGDFIDCRKMGSGKSISANIDDYSKLDSDAEFVLVIEKDAVFNRLAQDQFYDYIPSIIITAKGQPDMATRMFLKKIHDELKLPILALMDSDIYGFEILRVYSVGSKALSFEAANLAVPDIKWLGLLPEDLEPDSPYEIPKSTHLKLSKSDERRIKLILDEEFVKRKPKWKAQIELMLKQGFKAEIQALNAIDAQYITNFYLPHKIENESFI